MLRLTRMVGSRAIWMAAVIVFTWTTVSFARPAGAKTKRGPTEDQCRQTLGAFGKVRAASINCGSILSPEWRRKFEAETPGANRSKSDCTTTFGAEFVSWAIGRGERDFSLDIVDEGHDGVCQKAEQTGMVSFVIVPERPLPPGYHRGYSATSDRRKPKGERQTIQVTIIGGTDNASCGNHMGFFRARYRGRPIEVTFLMDDVTDNIIERVCGLGQGEWAPDEYQLSGREVAAIGYWFGNDEFEARDFILPMTEAKKVSGKMPEDTRPQTVPRRPEDDATTSAGGVPQTTRDEVRELSKTTADIARRLRGR